MPFDNNLEKTLKRCIRSMFKIPHLSTQMLHQIFWHISRGTFLDRGQPFLDRCAGLKIEGTMLSLLNLRAAKAAELAL